MIKWIVILLCGSSLIHAHCTLYHNEQPVKEKMNDPLFFLVSNSSRCPGSIQELKQRITVNGLLIQTSMVANRGRKNPSEGSFSFFESIYGQLPTGESINKGSFFLGYFTALKDGTLILDQAPEHNKLLIEVIAWDKQKMLFNFYELRGLKNGQTRWFYRGDSKDAYKDNTWLYRDHPENEPHFGSRMRCSACHNSGGPIFKEMAQPHNDWWTSNRPLILKPNTPDNEVQALVEQVVDADMLAHDVQQGAAQLVESNEMIQFQSTLSLQEQLRPLFCTTEINLESNLKMPKKGVAIPSAFWINPLLGHIDLSVSADEYQQLLESFDMQFPETSLKDADHSWHTPVKGEADLNAIKNLVQNNVITASFAKAVLLIDFAHPVFSNSRCELLKLLPIHKKEKWLDEFIMTLQHHDEMPAAVQLVTFLNKLPYDMLENYRTNLTQLMRERLGLHAVFQQLIDVRHAVNISEISQNPKGQILEPGFRVIFPESKIRE